MILYYCYCQCISSSLAHGSGSITRPYSGNRFPSEQMNSNRGSPNAKYFKVKMFSIWDIYDMFDMFGILICLLCHGCGLTWRTRMIIRRYSRNVGMRDIDCLLFYWTAKQFFFFAMIICKSAALCILNLDLTSLY